MTSLRKLVFVDLEEGETAHLSDENQRLSLAYEELTDMPYNLLDCYAGYVHTLDLTYNKFRTVDFLSEFVNLTSLILDHNEIDSDTVFPGLHKLKLLWLNHNKVSDLYPFIQNLQKSCPNLQHLSLMGNAAAPSCLNGGSIYDHLQYRLFVISWFDDLIHLDDRAVDEDQRKEACRLFRRPLLTRLRVEASLPSHLRKIKASFSSLLGGWSDIILHKQSNAVV
ncbi:leucine-rich melanocyte differentiation-associated protein-like [Bacillus rossius redtenbacheri]|uniref:leucine-rich melanocyte differentiation-associated protein-like n=1 Tax=Bacillus rossius redtenbacheri TaxID=93214 RepID=UPI002FDEAEB8